MLTRLVFGLVLGLLMYRPRPTDPGIPGITPPDLPPGADEEVPPIDIGPPVDIEPPIYRHPKRPGPTPSVPPTPPPGYDGEWPPASERDAPPSAPPGHDGTWPPASERRSIIERLRELIQELRRMPIDGSYRTGVSAAHAGADRVSTVEDAGIDVQAT